MSLSKFSNRALSKNEMSKVNGGSADACSICNACLASGDEACSGTTDPGQNLACRTNLAISCRNQSYCNECYGGV